VAIETSTGRGVPDDNACWEGKEFWIEFKKVRGRKVRVSPEQVGWAERRLRAGGKVYVAVRDAGTLSLFTGWQLRELKLNHVNKTRPIGSWTGGPTAWQWLEIAAILAS
jgi:Holliday junction resolvase